jgi:hypothetical protein
MKIRDDWELCVEQYTSHCADEFRLLQRNESFLSCSLFIYSFHLVSPQTKPNPEVLIRLDAHAEITKPNHQTLLSHGQTRSRIRLRMRSLRCEDISKTQNKEASGVHSKIVGGAGSGTRTRAAQKGHWLSRPAH